MRLRHRPACTLPWRPPSASGTFLGRWLTGAVVLRQPPTLPIAVKEHGLPHSPGEGRAGPACHQLLFLFSSHTVTRGQVSERGGFLKQTLLFLCLFR